MAHLQSFAEVVGSEELSGFLNETGESPGRPLREYVELSEGTYIYDVPFTSVDQQRLLSVSELASDQRLLEIASAGSVPVSLDHLRGRDADQTLVRVGYMIDYSEDEARALGLASPKPRA
jgi:hypothetical protein